MVNLKTQLAQIETKLQKLLDVYLEDALTQKEYAAKKDVLISQKVALNEKIADFETKGLSWLEPAREFVLSLNQAAKLIETENLTESGISFCPEKSVRFGRRARAQPARGIDFSNVVQNT